jgi:hypothetical protein
MSTRRAVPQLASKINKLAGLLVCDDDAIYPRLVSH